MAGHVEKAVGIRELFEPWVGEFGDQEGQTDARRAEVVRVGRPHLKRVARVAGEQAVPYEV